MKPQSLIRPAALALSAVCAVYGQTLINLGTQARNIDFSAASSTRPEKTGAAAPATCATGDLFFNTAATVGQNLLGCVSNNTWSLLGGNVNAGLKDPGANGLLKRTALNITGVATYPDIVALFGAGSCSGYLKSDGTCSTPTSSGTYTLPSATASMLGGVIVSSGGGLSVDGSGNLSISVHSFDAYGAAATAQTNAEAASDPSGAATAAVAAVPVSGSAQTLNALISPADWGTFNAKQSAGHYLVDAGANGLLKRTALDTTSVATYPDIVALFGAGSCSGYLKSDGTCSTPTSSGTYTLPSATASVLGGVIVSSGGGLSVDGSGNLSIPAHSFDAYGAAAAITLSGLGGVTAAQAAADAPVQTVAGRTGAVTLSAADVSGLPTFPVGGIVGTTDTQTLTNKSISASQINSGTLSASRMPAFSGDISIPAGSTVATLATVNASAGSYGDSAHSVQVTVDGKGRITSIGQIAISGGGGSGIPAGLLASLPSSCTSGSLYFATDQPPGQQIYTCSATNTWTQFLSLGGSGALAFDSSGDLDIVTTVVPVLAAANMFSGLNTFSQAPVLPQSTPSSSSASCNAGAMWADANYIYVCTATNTIKRSALSSF